jgi:competence CoiA-like predicted nuclease
VTLTIIIDCPSCHAEVSLRKDGTIRPHLRKDVTGNQKVFSACESEGMIPKKVVMYKTPVVEKGSFGSAPCICPKCGKDH